MKKILFIFFCLFLLCPPVFATSHGYFEYRHGLISTEPTLVGAKDCPCMGWSATLGVVWSKWHRKFLVNAFTRATGQTRWDDPEVYQFTVDTRLRVWKGISLLLGYTEKHNLDRSTPKGTHFVDWQGLRSYAPGELGWGWSGVRTLYTGVRVDLW